MSEFPAFTGGQGRDARIPVPRCSVGTCQRGVKVSDGVRIAETGRQSCTPAVGSLQSESPPPGAGGRGGLKREWGEGAVLIEVGAPQPALRPLKTCE